MVDPNRISICPHRKVTETFEMYRARRRKYAKLIKLRMRNGRRVLWSNGTYVRSIHGKLN